MLLIFENVSRAPWLEALPTISVSDCWSVSQLVVWLPFGYIVIWGINVIVASTILWYENVRVLEETAPKIQLAHVEEASAIVAEKNVGL